MKTEPILFSIIIPTYNRADLIMETLETVFDQTYPHYEAIVVDNCSTDHTEQLLKPLAETNKIKYIRHDRNYERSKSRNTGMCAAEGDFLTFLDSDDFMYKDCLNDAANYIYKNPDIKFFQNLYELVNNKKERIYSYKFPSLRNQYRALANGNFVSCIGGFLHRDIYKEIHFMEDMKMIGSEDYDVWFKVMARCKMGRINKVNSGIREHVSRSVNEGIYENLSYQMSLVLRNIENDPITYSKFKPYLKRLKASFYLQQAVVSNKLNDKRKAKQSLLNAFNIDPSIIFTSRYLKIFAKTIKL